MGMLDRRSVSQWGPAVVIAALLAPASLAQEGRLQKFERQMDQIRRETRFTPNPDIPASQRMLVDYGASFTFAFALIDDLNQQTHVLRQTEANAYLRVELDGVHQFFFRSRTIYRDFNAGHSFDGQGDDWVEPNLDRAHYRFDLGRAIAQNEGGDEKWKLALQVGRQLVRWGNGLTLSEEMDGGVFTIGYDKTRIDVLVAQMRTSVADFDSSRPDFDHDTDRNFFGGILRHNVGCKHTLYVYGLVQRDQTDDAPRTDTPGGFTDFDYDSWYIGIGSGGALSDRVRYGIEFVYESGDGLSTDFPTVQTREDIEAWALDLVIEYLPTKPHRPRYTFELLLASGDSDRMNASDTVGGNRPGTDDNAFNAFGLIYTGYAFSPNASNLMMFRFGVSAFPFPNSERLRRLQIGGNVLIFNKMNKVGSIDEPSSNHRYLGTELDIYANWQITSDLSLAVRYGVLFPGEGLASDADERHFLYSGVTLAF